MVSGAGVYSFGVASRWGLTIPHLRSFRNPHAGGYSQSIPQRRTRSPAERARPVGDFGRRRAARGRCKPPDGRLGVASRSATSPRPTVRNPDGQLALSRVLVRERARLLVLGAGCPLRCARRGWQQERRPADLRGPEPAVPRPLETRERCTNSGFPRSIRIRVLAVEACIQLVRCVRSRIEGTERCHCVPRAHFISSLVCV